MLGFYEGKILHEVVKDWRRYLAHAMDVKQSTYWLHWEKRSTHVCQHANHCLTSKSSLADITITTLAFFQLMFIWHIFFHLFVFNLNDLNILEYLCKKHITMSYKPSPIFWLFTEEFQANLHLLQLLDLF